jgi:uncharacterized protein (UPF0261 family)
MHMETIQAVVESKETHATVEQMSERAAAEVLRNLSAIELSAVGGGSGTALFF